MSAISKLTSGAAILTDWLGDDQRPVDRSLSQSRANVCAHCDQNARKMLLHLLEAPVIEAIRLTSTLKGRMKLSVEGESGLGTCKICLCHLPTKVHVPMSHIQAHTDENVWTELKEKASHCWMLNERTT